MKKRYKKTEKECTIRMGLFEWPATTPFIITRNRMHPFTHERAKQQSTIPFVGVCVLWSLSVNTVIAENFASRENFCVLRVKISYSSVCQLSYAGNFRTATVVSDTHARVWFSYAIFNLTWNIKSSRRFAEESTGRRNVCACICAGYTCAGVRVGAYAKKCAG